MRRLIVSEFMTLDGVMEAPDQWSFKFWSEEQAKYKYDELFASDALLLGRVTYEEFASAWPTMTEETAIEDITEGGGSTGPGGDMAGFAGRMNSLPKHVVSTTLEKADWNNSCLINGHVVNEVSRLKQQPGQDILLYGSADLVDSLMQHHLVDEYRLMVFPIVVGSGKRLFKDTHTTTLKLVDTATFGPGVVVLTYKPNGTDGDT